MLKVAYYTEVNLNNHDGPAVNELEFISSLSSNISNAVVFVENKHKKLFKGKENVFFFALPGRISHLFSYWKIFRQIQKIVRKHKTNLLVVRLMDFPLVILLLKLFNPGINLYVKTAALWWVGRENNSIGDFLYNKINNFLTKIAYKISLGVDVAMVETKEELTRLGLVSTKNCRLIDNAINVDRFRSNETQMLNAGEKIILGFAGSLPSYRGARQMLEVGNALLNKYNIAVMIVGDDDELDNVIAQSHFPQNKIMRVGKVSYFEVATYIQKMTICYSFFEKWQLEKTGNASQKVKHYIAMGKPVISVKSGHQYLIDNELGSVVDQDNISEIVRETEKWIQRVEKEGVALSQRLHEYAKKYLSTEKTFRQRVEFWHSLVDKGFGK